MASKAVLVHRQVEAARKERDDNMKAAAEDHAFDNLNPEYQLEKVENFWHGVKEKSLRKRVASQDEEDEDNDLGSKKQSSNSRLSLLFGNTDYSKRSSLTFSFLADDLPESEPYILDPQGSLKVLWDVFICVLVVYSLVVIPIGIGFDTTAELPTEVLDYMVTGFFFLDILVSFNTAYMDEDTEKLEFDRLHIAKHYLKFWFWVDLFSTIPFDTIVSSIISNSDLSAIRAIRILRLVRLAKLYRLANIDESLERYHISPSIVNLVILVIQIFFVAHYFACFWHFLSLDNVQHPEPPRNWVEVFGFDVVDVYDRYVASLYYIIVTMLTIGYGDISPTNDIERIYGIFTMLTGAVVFGALTSKVASIIERRNPEVKAMKESINELKSLMFEFKYERDLKLRVKSAYEYYLTKKSPYGEVEFFDELPQPILHRLFRQLYGRHIQRVFLFQTFEKVFVVSLLRDLKPMNAVKDEIIYGQNDVCNEIVFVTMGGIGMFTTDRRDHHTEQVHDVAEAMEYSSIVLKQAAPKVYTSGAMVGYVTSGFYFGDIEYHLNISSIGTYVATTYTQLLSIGHRTMDVAKGESLGEAQRFDKMTQDRINALKEVLRPLYPRTLQDIRKYEFSAAKEKAPSVQIEAPVETPIQGRKRKSSSARRRGSSISSRISEGTTPLTQEQLEVALRAFAHRWELPSHGHHIAGMHSHKSVDHSHKLPEEVAAQVPEEFKLSPLIDAPKVDPVELDVEYVQEFCVDGCVPEIWLDGEIVNVHLVADMLSSSERKSSKVKAVLESMHDSLQDSQHSTEDSDDEADSSPFLFRAVTKYKIDPNTKFQTPVIEDINESYYTDNYLVNPQGVRKIYWDFFIGFLIIYSVIIVPVEIAFNTLAYPGSDIIDLIVNGFFLLDIIASFRTAYFDETLDAVVTTDREIAVTYARTWFPIDFISTVPFDAIISAAVAGGTNLTFTKLLKIVRLFRLLKMARLLKLGAYVETAEDVLGLSPAVFGLLSMMIIVFFLSHWVACILWGMSTLLSENRWYDQDDLVYSDFTSKILVRQYLLALYWTVTIMTTVGYGDISPINTYDRILNIFVLLLAGSTFGYMIANVSDLIQSLNEGDAQRSKKLSDIADFLDEKECPEKIRDEVMKHFKNKYREDTAFDLTKIWRRLPPRLAIKIRLSHHDIKLKTIPICNNLLNDSVRLYIFELLEAHFYESRQKIVEQGVKSEEIFFFVSGSAVAFFDESCVPAINTSTAVHRKPTARRVTIREDAVCSDEEKNSADDEAGEGKDHSDQVALEKTVESEQVTDELINSRDEEGLDLDASREEDMTALRPASGTIIDPEVNASLDLVADEDFAVEDSDQKASLSVRPPGVTRAKSFSAARRKLNAEFISLNQVKSQTFGDDALCDSDDEGEFSTRMDVDVDTGEEFDWTPKSFSRIGLQYVHEIEPYKNANSTTGLFCGHVSLFHGSEYHLSVVAKNDCVVYVLTKSKIERLIREEPTVGRQLEESLAVSIRKQRAIIIKILRDLDVDDSDIRSKTLSFLGDLRTDHAAPSRDTTPHPRSTAESVASPDSAPAMPPAESKGEADGKETE